MHIHCMLDSRGDFQKRGDVFIVGQADLFHDLYQITTGGLSSFTTKLPLIRSFHMKPNMVIKGKLLNKAEHMLLCTCYMVVT